MSQTPTADVSRYTYRVTWSVEDGEFVATCAEFPSLSRLADSQAAALQGLVDLAADTGSCRCAVRRGVSDLRPFTRQLPRVALLSTAVYGAVPTRRLLVPRRSIATRRKGERSWVVWLAIASGAFWLLFMVLSATLG